MYCLPKHIADNFLKSIKEGTIDPVKLQNMTSEERNKFLAGIVGEGHASKVNAELEKKLLLKNVEKGIVNWAQWTGGLKKQARRDLISQAGRMSQLLNPTNEYNFYKDLVSYKFGTNVTMEETRKIGELSKAAIEARTKMENSPRRTEAGKQTDAEKAYGDAAVAYLKYVDELKKGEKKVSLSQIPTLAAGLSRAMRSAWDISFAGRQGVKSLLKVATGDLKSGQTWLKTLGESIKQFYNTFGENNAMDQLHSMIISDPDYEKMKKAGISLMGTVEEEIPVEIQNKIPVLGKIFEASENAYVGAAEYMRYMLGKTYLEVFEKSGADINNKKTLEAMGSIVNTLTGRTSRQGKPGIINALIWAPNLIKSNVNILTGNQVLDPTMKGQSVARKQAAISSIRIIGGIAAIATVANMIAPGSVETDPRSADFMKIKVGDQRIDFTGGLGQYTVLAARLATKESKSSTTGIVSKYGTEFGQKSRFDAITDFITYKASPAASVGITYLKGHTFEGKEPKIQEELIKMFTPLPAEQVYKAYKEGHPPANQLLNAIAEGLGFGSNIYSTDMEWSEANVFAGKQIKQFTAEHNKEEVKQAQSLYNKGIAEGLSLLKKQPYWRIVGENMQDRLYSKLKRDVLKKVFAKFKFDYTPEQSESMPKIKGYDEFIENL